MTELLDLAFVTFPAVVKVVGVSLVSGLVTFVFAGLHRWYVRERVPMRFALILGLGVVALLLNTASTLGQYIGGGDGVLQFNVMLLNTVALGIGGLTSALAAGIGDNVTSNLLSWRGIDTARIVRSVGRVITVQLPDEIGDIEGYDPVYEDVKESLQGSEHVFPRGLTVQELRDRLVSRIKKDYSVGHVDIELNSEGEVEYVAVGSRTAGIGPTLAPNTVAIAVEADPAYSSSPGDRVQLWREGSDEPERVASGEVRGTCDDTVTVAVDQSDVEAFGSDPQKYRLVTLSSERQPEREFLSLLRASDETMNVLDIGPDSVLIGVSVGESEATVIAVRKESGEIEAIPGNDYVFGEGDTVYTLGRPEVLRKFESGVG